MSDAASQIPEASYNEKTKLITINIPGDFVYTVTGVKPETADLMPKIYEQFVKHLKNNPSTIMQYIRETAIDLDAKFEIDDEGMPGHILRISRIPKQTLFILN